MDIEIPSINAKFICIADRGRPDLAAIISSYFSEKSNYLPVFEFPFVSAEKHDYKDDVLDEDHLSVTRADEFSVFVNNVLARIGGTENVILAGLSKEQKSYLDFISHTNVIDIDEKDKIDFFLSPYQDHPKEILSCRYQDLLIGCAIAMSTGKILEITEDAEPLQNTLDSGKGLVVIEDDQSVATVVALNYAQSIDANIFIVDKLGSDDKYLMQTYLQEWQNGDNEKFKIIEKLVNDRIGYLSFPDYTFATFFTRGLPYSLILKNCIPFSYVNVDLRPDFFVINNLLYQSNVQYSAAVVFSPGLFKDEETKSVSAILSSKNYFTKELFGKSATVRNLDMNLKEFPYDIFHLCTHGGEILGTPIEEEFTDRDGLKHTVEYDSVLSISPSSKPGFLTVQHKSYYRKFDGYLWGSKKLKELDIPQYVFADMVNSMRISKAPQHKVLGPRKRVPNSCEIVCSDGTHQGMLSTVASHTYPFIFNNTCWSWLHIAENFLAGGGRGYIGTLWKVNNSTAVDFAKQFYSTAFNGTILNAFHGAMATTIGSNSEHIYIYWGLHCAKFTPPQSPEESRAQTFMELHRSMYLWKNKLSITRNRTSADLIAELMKWDLDELSTNFNRKDYELFREKAMKKKNTKN